MNPEWQTPEELAIELGRSPRFVKEQMAAGIIPSIKLGSHRYFTPECRARLVAQQLGAVPTPAESWGRASKKKAS